MKTTIKLDPYKSLTVEPCRMSDLVCLTILKKTDRPGGLSDYSITAEAYMTPDQVGALIFGLEQATPETVAARIKREFDAECM